MSFLEIKSNTKKLKPSNFSRNLETSSWSGNLKAGLEHELNGAPQVIVTQQSDIKPFTFHLLADGESRPLPLSKIKQSGVKPKTMRYHLCCLRASVRACTDLWQAEGNAPRCHGVVGLDCEDILVVGCGLHRHVPARVETQPELNFPRYDMVITRLLFIWKASLSSISTIKSIKHGSGVKVFNTPFHLLPVCSPACVWPDAGRRCKTNQLSKPGFFDHLWKMLAMNATTCRIHTRGIMTVNRRT